MEKAIFKFNGGNIALLCSKCQEVIKTVQDFTKEELLASQNKTNLPPQYCKKHKNEKFLN